MHASRLVGQLPDNCPRKNGVAEERWWNREKKETATERERFAGISPGTRRESDDPVTYRRRLTSSHAPALTHASQRVTWPRASFRGQSLALELTIPGDRAYLTPRARRTQLLATGGESSWTKETSRSIVPYYSRGHSALPPAGHTISQHWNVARLPLASRVNRLGIFGGTSMGARPSNDAHRSRDTIIVKHAAVCTCTRERRRATTLYFAPERTRMSQHTDGP